MIHTTLPSTSNDVSKSGQIEDIIHFLFDMIKDELTALDDPRFSFYRYVDQKLNTPLLSAVALGAEPLFLNLSGLKSDSAQSPASTPKFISSEDNTQTKTNYYTEPSIGILIYFRIKLNNRYVITSTKKRPRLRRPSGRTF